MHPCTLFSYLKSIPQFSVPHTCESHTQKLRLHYGHFVWVNSKMANKIAGQPTSTEISILTSSPPWEPSPCYDQLDDVSRQLEVGL